MVSDRHVISEADGSLPNGIVAFYALSGCQVSPRQPQTDNRLGVAVSICPGRASSPATARDHVTRLLPEHIGAQGRAAPSLALADLRLVSPIASIANLLA